MVLVCFRCLPFCVNGNKLAFSFEMVSGTGGRAFESPQARHTFQRLSKNFLARPSRRGRVPRLCSTFLWRRRSGGQGICGHNTFSLNRKQLAVSLDQLWRRVLPSQNSFHSATSEHAHCFPSDRIVHQRGQGLRERKLVV